MYRPFQFALTALLCLALTGCAERAKSKLSTPVPPDSVSTKNECVRDVQCLPDGWKYSETTKALYCKKPSRIVAKLVCRGAK
jgi:hypothetical protein